MSKLEEINLKKICCLFLLLYFFSIHYASAQNTDDYQNGYEKGISDYQKRIEKNSYEIYLSAEENAEFTRGYVAGVSFAENEAKAVDPREQGYADGFEAATEEFLYDDYNRDLSETKRLLYQEGYMTGYIEGGGGSLNERISYYLLQKYQTYTITISVIIFSILISMLLYILRKKGIPLKRGFVISFFTIAVGIFFFFMVNLNRSEPTNVENNDNPYSYTSEDHNCDDFDTQEDAQMFYEANGGPEEDLHDLDRDQDGKACDWNL
jgi:hypothetical protein